jgi:DNA gyrase inhibitor GyrI
MSWLAARGLHPAGAPLIRYRSTEGATFDVDLGVPLDAGTGEVVDAGEVTVERLPAGRYAVVRHVGPFDGLAAAHTALEQWAAGSGVAFDEDRGARVEHYLVDPSAEPDPARWVTEIEQLVAAGERGQAGRVS